MPAPETTPDDVVTVPLNKRKLALHALGSLAFVVLGACILFVWPLSRALRIVVGAPAIAFFGLTLVLNLRRLLHPRPGLILSAEGIVDRGSGLSLGLVRWSDIEEIKAASINGTKFLVLKVRDPAPYLARGNALQRMTHRANTSLVGSPVTLAAVTLSISFAELEQLVRKHHVKYSADDGAPKAPLPTARVVR